MLSTKPTGHTKGRDWLKWSSSDDNVVQVADGTIKGISNGTATITASCEESSGIISGSLKVTGNNLDSDGFELGAVDLGLSVKWANANVGASCSEDSGEYFAWGEVESKDEYTYDNYRFHGNSKYASDGKYNSYDNKVVLDLEDDAAHVKLGDTWRMPTIAEWVELKTKCTLKRTTQRGVNGIIVTGPNGQEIFLPACGFWLGTKFPDHAGLAAYYWSSSLSRNDNYPDDYNVAYLSEFTSVELVISSFSRCYGYPIRPVCP